MPGTPVPLGPWAGGMNNDSEIATIADDEVAFLENFEQDADGSMVSRPAIVSESTAVTGDLQGLGYYIDAANTTFLVVATATNTQLYNVATKAWTVIWGERASGFVQYDNKAVLISETVAGGYWTGASFVSTPTMPKGSQIVFYQERLWAYGVQGTADATTVWFSKLTVISPASSIFDWATNSDYFTVGLGDGEWITGLVADLNALLIFKNRSTWQFSYPSAPSAGTLRQISATIGAENRWSVASYENYYLVYCAGYVYQFINYRHYPLNQRKIDFRRSSLTSLQFEIRVSIFGHRLLVWFYGNTYVYNIIAGNWSTWSSPATSAGQFFTIPASSSSGDSRAALAITGANDAAKKRLWKVSEDVLSSGEGEEFTCTMRTKAYSMDEAAQYKRLLYWGVEVASSSGIEAIAHPIAVPRQGSTWNAMDLTTWNILDEGSWNNPFIDPPKYLDDVQFPTSAPVHTTVKVTGAFRFLSAYFEVFMACDGTSRTAPARIYSITPYLKVKANVSSKVS